MSFHPSLDRVWGIQLPALSTNICIMPKSLWTSHEGWLTCAILPHTGASRSGRLLITLRLAEGKRAGNVQLNAALIFAAVCSSCCFYCEGPKDDGILSCCVLKRL